MDTDSPRLRLSMLGVVVFSLFATLFARLWYLQVMVTDEGEVEAAANRVRVLSEEAPRGRILDAAGRVLVDNRTSLVVAVDRTVLADLAADERDDLLLRLATELTRSGVPTKVSSIERRLNDPQYSPLQPIPVAVDVPEELQVYLAEEAEHFPGVEVHRESVRAYPEGTLAAHVVGYVGRISPEEYESRMGTEEAPVENPKPYQPGSSIGKTGVEMTMEDQLRGTPGERTVEIDAQGRVVRQVDYRPPVPGNDVQLTIDIDVQRVSEERLAEQLEGISGTYTNEGRLARAPAGSAVVLDPNNGNVLALASYPTYDPAEFVNGISYDRYAQLVGGDASANPLTDRAIGGLYAPGSTFKLITAWAALERGLIDGTTGYTDGGTYQVGNRVFKSPEGGHRGWVQLPQALTYSSDVFFYWLGDRFWVERDQRGDGIQDTARAFGLGSKTGVDLPGELGGVVPDPAWKQQLYDSLPPDQQQYGDGKWYAGDNVNLSIGQGDMLVTPLQLTNAYAQFAAGGTRYRPNLVLRVLRPKGDPANPADVVFEHTPEVAATIDMPPALRDPIEQGLEGVTTLSGGTATTVFEDFDQSAFPVAGKTGTAQVNNKADNALFVGYGPANAPRYVVTAVLEESGFGSEAAAPVVRDIFAHLAGQDQPADPAEGTSGAAGATATNGTTGAGTARGTGTTVTTAPAGGTGTTGGGSGATGGGAAATTTAPTTTARRNGGAG